MVFRKTWRPFSTLLPIREAYEWKLFVLYCAHYLLFILLPIREAYEWKLNKRKQNTKQQYLLPIREAYEWKPVVFVYCGRARGQALVLLPIREAYEWKHLQVEQPLDKFFEILASNS